MKLSAAIANNSDIDSETRKATRDALDGMDEVIEAFRTFQTAFDAYRTLVEEAVKRGENG